MLESLWQMKALDGNKVMIIAILKLMRYLKALEW